MDGDVAGIRIEPPVVEFVDAPVSKIVSAKVTVRNVSKTSRRIQFHSPVTDKFHLWVKNPVKPVAPGLEVQATVEYESHISEDARDRIILAVDDNIVEIPLYAYTPTPLLDLEGPVDFGIVVANSKVLSQEIALINHGSVPGEFQIEFEGNHPIVISPTSGKVNPKTIQLIKVEIITETPCTLNETARVMLEGLQDTELHIKGRIVEQSLELLSIDGSPLKCVPFGPVYYGTDKIYSALLYNNGPEEIKWVSVLQEGVHGEEAGTDLTKSTAATLATSPMERIRGKAYDILTSLITVFPNQGWIEPYKKVQVFFRFSPRFNSSMVGWESSEKPPPRQDFALFTSFEMVGSNDSFLSPRKKLNRQVEAAVTATAIPVLVNIMPNNVFDFGAIECGETTHAMCKLVNESALLPLGFEFRKVAHFEVSPKQDVIEPGNSKEVYITFYPRQAGTFQPIQIIDVIGSVVAEEDDSATPKLLKKKFQEIPIQYLGTADPKKIKLPSLNAESTQMEQMQGKGADGENTVIVLPNDRAQSIRPSNPDYDYVTPFTRLKRHTYVDPDYALTEKEDLEKTRHKQKYIDYLRISAENRKFGGTTGKFKSHDNAVDLGIPPAQGLVAPKLSSKDIESGGTRPGPGVSENLRLLTTRQLANQERNTAARPISEGLNAVPMTDYEKVDCQKTLSPQDLHKIIIGPPTIDFGQVCLRSTNVKQLNIVNNLDQYIHIQVAIDCKELRQTSPLSQVVPPLSKAQLGLVFESALEGRFQRSIMYTVNGQNDSHILVLANVVPVALELSTRKLELVQTPGSPADAGYRAVITLQNNRNYAAEFTWSPILKDRGTAFSVRPATGMVEAFKDLKCEVVFHPSYFAPLEGSFHLQVHNGNSIPLSCVAKLGATNVQFVQRRIQFGDVPVNMRTVRTALLRNTGRNHALFYVINPNPFPGMTIAPVHGIIPVGGNTELKIYLQPSAVMKFDIWIRVNIRGWKTIDLRMGGTVEPPAVDIDEKTFKFDGVYCESTVSMSFNLINLTSTRVKVDFDLSKYMDFTLSFPDEEVDDDPRDQLQLLPNTYSVELTGHQTLPCTLTFRPTAVASYDFTLPVAVNRTAAPSPTPSSFPPTPAPSERHIVTPKHVTVSLATARRRITATSLRPLLSLSSWRFEFSLPMPFIERPVPDHALGDKKQLTLTNNSNENIHWRLDPTGNNKFLEDVSFVFLKPGGATFQVDQVEGVLSPNKSFDLTILFCPRRTGNFFYRIPLIVNCDKNKPYRMIELNAVVQPPKITFDPLALVLTPVPLTTAVYAEFNIIATGYHRESKLTCSVPDVEMEDMTKLQCFSVEFPEGCTVKAQAKEDTETGEPSMTVLPCVLCFLSPQPVSTSTDITFTDAENRKFVITVTATADNCLLTVYPFLAAHRNDHQIVCEQNKTINGPAHRYNSVSLGEAVILPCTSPHRPSTRGSTSVTSSHFGASSSTYDDSSNNMSDSASPRSIREGEQLSGNEEKPESAALTKDGSPSRQLPREPGESMIPSQMHAARQDLVSRSLGSAAFPFDSSLEAHFHHEVLQSVQRWFSNYGWPGGPFPITIPQSMRGLITRMPYDDSDFGPPVHETRRQQQQATTANPKRHARPGYTPSDTSGLRKDVKTIYDMLHHMCGRMVPGIPINQPLPRDPNERVLQLHWQHSTLLTFLKGQGAAIAAVKPEFLFTPKDYRRWVKIRQKESKKEAQDDDSGGEGFYSEANNTFQPNAREKSSPATLHIENDLFESVSTRAWTDLLLQLIKVMVLSRVTPKNYRGIKAAKEGNFLPRVNPDPLASNVYSVGERIILAWLNHHYERQRHRLWEKRTDKGGVPPSRWVVNFDYDLLDGLVLAAVVAAHCPWLIEKYLSDMYTSPSSPEQCLHNTLILVNALAQIGIDYDIQATDVTDPNPIALLLLCIHLYQHLPHYVPRSQVLFTGSLHSIVHRQVRITNPSSKPLVYTITLWGRDAKDFFLPNGSEITIPAREEKNLDIEFASRFLRPAEAMLVLVGRREAAFSGPNTTGIAVGATLVFSMETSVDDISPLNTVKCQTPCYELKKIDMKVRNPFPEGGNFKIILIESSDSLPTPIEAGRVHSVKSKKSTLSSRIKSVKSKTDHGQQKDRSSREPASSSVSTTPESVVVRPREDRNLAQGRGPMTSQLTAFFCKQSHVFLETETPTVLKLEFLPFRCGKKFCSVLFSSDTVGEFLYAIEAVVNLPLPSPVPFNPNSPQSVRISSAAAAARGKGLFGGNERIVYWKCEYGATLEETLLLPITNESKERALVIAAQQRMTDKEKERRALTGTLESGTVTANIMAMSLCDPEQARHQTSTMHLSAPPPPIGTLFSVEVSSDCFQVPSTIIIPSPMTFGPPPASEIKGSKYGPNDRQDDGTVPLVVKFKPKGTGHYLCDLVLRSSGDIRVYRIECTVTPAGTTAHFEFKTPAHQPVKQNIPIQNASNHDWDLDCKLLGEGFRAPDSLMARCGSTTYYPLTFNPQFECNVSGKLVIRNRSDGTTHVFQLRGIGERPLALAALDIQCQCHKVVTRSVDVPNYTQKKIVYNVFSDVPFLDGPSTVSVLPGQTTSYTFTLCPWSRGKYSGILSFQGSSDTQLRDRQDASDSDDDVKDQDQDQEKSKRLQYFTAEDQNNNRYRVWYTVLADVAPPKAEKRIEIVCPAQKSSELEIPINNPTTEPITFNVSYSGRNLSGKKTITIVPRVAYTYHLTYSPKVVGQSSGNIIFQSDLTGEFWYELDLHAVSPTPVTIPRIDCELGRWARSYFTVKNMTSNPMRVVGQITNSNNFSLDMDVEDEQATITVPPRSSADIPTQFMPTRLGGRNHEATVTMFSEELGKMVYWVSGRGLAPKLMEPLSVSAIIGSNTSLILPFRNPSDFHVLADVYISDFDHTMNQLADSVIRNNISEDSAFCLLLKHTSGIKLKPKESFDLPFTFSPDKMRKYEGALVISLSREDGRPWEDEKNGICDVTGTDGDENYANSSKLRPLSQDENGRIKSIRWVFPVHGIPEIRTKESKQAVLHCQARSRIEERLEVTLTGAVPSSASTHELARLRVVTPLNKQREPPRAMADGVAVEGHAVAEEFSFTVDYPSDQARNLLEPALVLSLLRKERDPYSGIVTLIFNVIFAPFRPLSQTVTLTVTSATGGMWRFPLVVRSSEGPADDSIKIEAAGLGKPSTVAFTLFSHTRHPVPFSAFFVSGSDAELSVTPQIGELLPQGSEGTKICVTFTPMMYGRAYRARLVVQTLDMQWAYDVVGTTPEYKPQQVSSTLFSVFQKGATRRLAQKARTNYVRENLKITATAVSSPIKGSALVVRSK